MSRFTGVMHYVKNSSQIARVGFMGEVGKSTGVMRVEFARGGIYEYSPLERVVYDGFWKADRKGVFFHASIKNGIGVEFKKIS